MNIAPGPLGKYELLTRLGEGGMAEVWKALDTRLQRHVAIKFLHGFLRDNSVFAARFVREAQAVASLHHPNIVQIYDFEAPDATNPDTLAYMVMDYIEGPTLAQYVSTTSHAQKFLSPLELVSLLLPISEAIDYAHQHGLLHRDIKPGNILLDQRQTDRNRMGEPILTDFGIVKMMGTASGTLTSASTGTPLYISPEQARGRPDTAASDIYSLGVILYEVCTGVLPFQGNNAFVILQQHISEPPPPPEQINPAISPALSAVILRCLAKEPEARFPTAMALMVALAEALGVMLPGKSNQPVSSPDLPLSKALPEMMKQAQEEEREDLENALTISPDNAETRGHISIEALETSEMQPTAGDNEKSPDPGSVASPLTPVLQAVPTPMDTPPGALAAVSEEKRVSVPDPVTPPPAIAVPPPTPAFPQKRKRQHGWLIILSVLLVVMLAASALTTVLVIRTHTSTSTPPSTAASNVVGQAFFTSSGTGLGANNLGLNDTLQVSLTSIPQPPASKQYYAWLLPDIAQVESSPRALGSLQWSDNSATLPNAYTDPQHANLIGLFSRLLVTEEDAQPVPQSPSLDTSKWRYYAQMPQSSTMQDCQVALNQLSVLCHVRHLLAGDPDVAKVHLQGGLNFWFLNNVEEIQKWAQEATSHSVATDIRHKIVNILIMLDGLACSQQDLQHAAQGMDNTPDDGRLPTVAAIPLLSCSLTPDLPSYMLHIDNHLNAIVSVSSVLSQQKTLAAQVVTELNTLNTWLEEMHNDAMQLLEMNNDQLIQLNGQNKRSALSTLATNVLSGGTDPSTGRAEVGAANVSNQIQQMATLYIMLYKGNSRASI